MSRMWRKVDVFLLVMALAGSSLSLNAQSQAKARKAPKAKAPELEVETVTPPPQPPPKPPTPAQLPAKPPEVILEDRQLWILADNSTLGDILNQVRTRTGAVIEVASGDVSERVMGRFGPGPARDVLSALLNGSHFNYVLTSPGNDPTGLSHVVLIPKPAGGNAVASGGQVYQGAAPQSYQAPAPVYVPPQQAPAQVPPQQAEQPPDDQNDQGDSAEADQAQQGEQNGEQQGNNPQGNQPTVKTPEQLLQELQKQQQLLLQQQRQQQQQQQQQGNNDQQPDSQDPQD
jgi:hypothetical protein